MLREVCQSSMPFPPRHVKTACNGRSGVLFVRRGFVRVECRCAGWLWLAANVVGVAPCSSNFAGFRQIPLKAEIPLKQS